ncbi:hypothetical protein V5P93_000447 [Actinokineospora auranticolor]|uniref:DNA-binding phage zinc finger domain-containing protein n=1 Tax=Actinokineospora auranticolor TaxID=155976 RepID=A0A2S6GE48_9PSEU|nr:hypothetical protein [Actinokineospora auranticolor]PPK63499.1 hypothetical protein CLV40_12726 [Actinokineospora auranticolor]
MTTDPTRQAAPPMSRVEVSGLLAMMAAFRSRTPSDTELRWWRDQLTGYSAAECQAAILAHSRTSPDSVTPAQIIGRIRDARHRTETRRHRLARDPAADAARSAAAARRGMAAVYAETGWTRLPEQQAALAVPCPEPDCGVPAGVMCVQGGRRDRRDSATGVHRSRRDAAEATADRHQEVTR